MPDYKKMWDELLFDMELAVQEGNARGFNENGDKFEDGQFFVYKFVLNKMNRMEGEFYESN